ncbi:OmpA family protein [Flavobacteriaceae bacterium M23B6Z8]
MKTKYIAFICTIFALLFGGIQESDAQFWKKLKKKAEQRAKETIERKVEEKTEQKTEQAIDSIFDITEKKGKKKKSTEQETDLDFPPLPEDQIPVEEIELPKEETTFEAYSKNDFTPGAKVLGYEDFSQDAVGDLPANWNTNLSAEVVTLSTHPGNWMQIGLGKGTFVADFLKEIPENFTLEFDLIYNFDIDSWAYSRSFGVVLSDSEDPNYEMNREWPGKNLLVMKLMAHVGSEYFKRTPNTKLNGSARNKIDELNKGSDFRGKVLHVSVWRQKSRVRMYVNGNKIFDVPRAFENGVSIQTVRFQSHISEQDEFFYLGNVRYAVGKPDMRNKLLSEGKLVTYGITFDTASAIIKPESHGTLKKIASILKQNPEVNVTVVGHTDADGDANYNMDLSMMRAAAVEQALIQQFGVSETQLSSEGKGETQLLDTGSDPESKARNRRVEIIKI